MLILAKIAQGSAGGYAEYLEGKSTAAELGDYYLKDGERVEAPGRWAQGAERFNLDGSGPVTGEQLRVACPRRFGPALVRAFVALENGREGALSMKRSRHTPEQVIRKLREAEVMLGEGRTIAEAAKELGVSEPTFHRWRNQYGGMKAQDAKRLKELERENVTLKQIVADKELEVRAPEEISRGNW